MNQQVNYTINLESIVKLGFTIVSTVHRDCIDLIVAQGVYSEFIDTMTKYCHCERFPKIKYD